MPRLIRKGMEKKVKMKSLETLERSQLQMIRIGTLSKIRRPMLNHQVRVTLRQPH
jgi:hypothetical protein